MSRKAKVARRLSPALTPHRPERKRAVQLETKSVLGGDEGRLPRVLSDRKWYSFSVRHVQHKLAWKSRAHTFRVAKSLGDNGGDTVNVFCLRRRGVHLDYKRDKTLGVNHVERKIARGDYD
jgi:hypothetical protein